MVTQAVAVPVSEQADRGATRKGRVGTEVTWKVSIAEVTERRYNLDIKNPHVVSDDLGNPAELLAKLNETEAQTASLRDRLKSILEEALLR